MSFTSVSYVLHDRYINACLGSLDSFIRWRQRRTKSNFISNITTDDLHDRFVCLSFVRSFVRWILVAFLDSFLNLVAIMQKDNHGRFQVIHTGSIDLLQPSPSLPMIPLIDLYWISNIHEEFFSTLVIITIPRLRIPRGSPPLVSWTTGSDWNERNDRRRHCTSIGQMSRSTTLYRERCTSHEPSSLLHWQSFRIPMA